VRVRSQLLGLKMTVTRVGPQFMPIRNKTVVLGTCYILCFGIFI